MESGERFVTRWHQAGLIDDTTAASIRSFEKANARPGSRRWQVLIALILGGILLGTGVLLFVAAHWEAISPISRMVLVLSMLGFFHGLGMLVRDRFAGLSTAMHAVGTVSAGAAIALIGQIFNMQEHWPSAVLLWAMCAATGWYLLRDEFQQTLTLLLVPAWIVAEWSERTRLYSGGDVYLARVLLVLGVVYLAAFLPSRRRAVFGILFGVGASMVPVSIGLLAEGWASYGQSRPWGFMPLHDRLVAFGMMALAGAFGWWINRESAILATVLAAVAGALPWAQTTATDGMTGHMWKRSEPSVAAYLMVGAAAVFLVWWGVRTVAKPLVNYGIVAFAVTVMWFYFSSVMDKLGRSLGLIVLGVLFLAGGWALEQTRRRLVASMDGGVA